jgi:hypothetical protein
VRAIAREIGIEVKPSAPMVFLKGTVTALCFCVFVILTIYCGTQILKGRVTIPTVTVLLVSALMLAVCSFVLPVWYLRLLRGDRYIIGQRALQLISGRGEVIENIPYDVIEDVRIDVQEVDNQKLLPPQEFVVITLKTYRSAGLFFSGKRGGRHARAGEYIIENHFALPPKDFYSAIIDAWRQWQQAALSHSAAPDRSTPPQRSKLQRTRIGEPHAALIGLASMVVCMTTVFGCIGGVFALQAVRQWGNAGQNEQADPGPRVQRQAEQPAIRANPKPKQPQADPAPVQPTAPGGQVVPLQAKHFLSDLSEFDVKAGPWPFFKDGKTGADGKIPIVVNGTSSPRGLAMHPPDLKFAAVKYRLGKQAAQLKAVVALNDSANRVLSAAIFEVLGDGRSLWKSAPVSKAGQSQECAVDVSGVEVLELRVHSTGSHFGLHAVWVDPHLVRKE